MRFLLAIAITLAASWSYAALNPPSPAPAKSSQEPKSQPEKPNQQSAPNKGNPYESPLSVTIDNPVTIKKSKEDLDYDRQQRNEKTSSDRWLIYLTGGLVFATFILAIITAILARYTYRLWEDASKTSDRQAKEMRRSLEIADRSAIAMNEVATATKNNALLMQDILQKQIRAYLAVDAGSATYQDSFLKFSASPILTNTGYTPARHISFKIKADILSIEDGANIVLDEPKETIINDASLPPRQQTVIQGLVDTRIPDEEVAEVMKGEKRRLFVWGTVTYKDIFGNAQETYFCHNYIFIRVGAEVKVNSYYHHQHNNAT